jgi:radical SAM protein with 4Fe4S-binding SPASM domain
VWQRAAQSERNTIVTSKKRWQEIYESENPFALPRSIVRGLREFTESASETSDQRQMRHLWIHTANGVPSDGTRVLSADDWLNLIDESAALGAESLVVSLSGGLKACPEALAMTEWAQGTHDMAVGFHVYEKALSRTEAETLTALDVSRTHIFAAPSLFEKMRFMEELGFNLHKADAPAGPALAKTCTWPEDMLCVCADGTMYACGLVLGNKDYSFGSFFDQRIDTVLADAARLRAIPEGHTRGNHDCSGCPALMEKALHDERLPGV